MSGFAFGGDFEKNVALMRSTWRANSCVWRTLGLAGILCIGGPWMGVIRADGPSAAAAIEADPAQARLKLRIQDMVGGMKDVPLPVIIEALTKHQVLPWKGESRETLLAVAKRVESLIEDAGIEAARMNEAGNQVENVVIEAMRGLGLRVDRAKAASGRIRSAGYPDLEVMVGETAFYVEVKAFSAATIDSTQRSFYLSPSTDFKVTRDAVHLLIAVELSAGAKGTYRAESVRWLDLSGLHCDLKYEFNASNRDLYRRESGLVIVELPKPPVIPPVGDPVDASRLSPPPR